MNPGGSAAIAFLTARGIQTCAMCRHFDPEPLAIDSGVRYCRRLCIWQWPGGGSECRAFNLKQETEDHANP